jgi:hypothetical protein
MRRTDVWLLSLALVGCANAAPHTATPRVAAQASGADGRELRAPNASAATATDPRELPLHATFADLVDAARKLDESASGHSAAGCLLRAGKHFSLQAEIAAGVRPLPSAPAELVSALEQAAGPAAVLSVWGSQPGETLEIALTAFTLTTTRAATEPALAVFLTRKGAYLRGASTVVRAHPESMPIATLGTWLGQAPLADAHTLYVSAEAAIPLEAVQALLTLVPEHFEVALAVALPKATRLPAAVRPSHELLCPEGLPELGADEAEGSLPTPALLRTLAPLRDAALACALSTGGRASLGGHLRLALRIGKDGRPSELCLSQDEISEPLLRRCIVESARGFRFPAPSPVGFVDVELPLQLTLAGPSQQRPLCE